MNIRCVWWSSLAQGVLSRLPQFVSAYDTARAIPRVGSCLTQTAVRTTTLCVNLPHSVVHSKSSAGYYAAINMHASCSEFQKQSPKNLPRGFVLYRVFDMVPCTMVFLFLFFVSVIVYDMVIRHEYVYSRSAAGTLTSGLQKVGHPRLHGRLHAAGARPLPPPHAHAVPVPPPDVGGTPVTLNLVPHGQTHIGPVARVRAPPIAYSCASVVHIEVHDEVVPPAGEQHVGASILHEALCGIYFTDTDPCKILIHSWCDLR